MAALTPRQFNTWTIENKNCKGKGFMSASIFQKKSWFNALISYRSRLACLSCTIQVMSLCLQHYNSSLIHSVGEIFTGYT